MIPYKKVSDNVRIVGDFFASTTQSPFLFLHDLNQFFQNFLLFP